MIECNMLFEKIDDYTITERAALARVQAEPEILFGSRGKEGTIRAVELLIKAFVEEISLGCSDNLTVKIPEKGRVIIEQTGRGLKVDTPKNIKERFFTSGFCFWLSPYESACPPNFGARTGFLFGNAHNENRFFTDEFSRTNEVFFLLNAICETIDVKSAINNRKFTFTIANNVINKCPVVAETAELDGTYLEFKLNNSVFDDVYVSAEDLTPILRTAAVSYPGSTLWVRECDTETKFSYENGVQSLLFKETCNTTPPSFWNSSDYLDNMNVSMCLAEKPYAESFHNGNTLEYASYQKAISEAVERIVSADESLPKKAKQFVLNHICFVVETKSQNTIWLDKERTKVENENLTQIAKTLIENNLPSYLEENRITILALADWQS